MRVLKYSLLGLLAVVALILLIGMALPSTYKVERSIEISAPMINVYPKVYDPKGWAQWGVWNRRDPGMQMTYSGPPAGVGAKWEWKSKSEGNGGMEIVKADFDKTVAYVLTIEGMDSKLSGRLDFANAGSKVKVTWVGEGDMGMNPLGRWFALFMDKLLGPDFEGSLKNLKELAERKG